MRCIKCIRYGSMTWLVLVCIKSHHWCLKLQRWAGGIPLFACLFQPSWRVNRKPLQLPIKSYQIHPRVLLCVWHPQSTIANWSAVRIFSTEWCASRELRWTVGPCICSQYHAISKYLIVFIYSLVCKCFMFFCISWASQIWGPVIHRQNSSGYHQSQDTIW